MCGGDEVGVFLLRANNNQKHCVTCVTIRVINTLCTVYGVGLLQAVSSMGNNRTTLRVDHKVC